MGCRASYDYCDSTRNHRNPSPIVGGTFLEISFVFVALGRSSNSNGSNQILSCLLFGLQIFKNLLRASRELIRLVS